MHNAHQKCMEKYHVHINNNGQAHYTRQITIEVVAFTYNIKLVFQKLMRYLKIKLYICIYNCIDKIKQVL